MKLYKKISHLKYARGMNYFENDACKNVLPQNGAAGQKGGRGRRARARR